MSNNKERRNTPRRVRCGWCPMLLPDDSSEWSHHHLIEHNNSGHSVRFEFGAVDWDDGLAALTGAAEQPLSDTRKES